MESYPWREAIGGRQGFHFLSIMKNVQPKFEIFIISVV